MDFFNQGIPLGRWFRIHVILHWTFLLYAAYYIYSAYSDQRSMPDAVEAAEAMGLLFGSVLLHEFGHALSCRAMGGHAERIILWPLGGIAFVLPPMNPWAWLVTTVCGPLVNLVIWGICWFILRTFHLNITAWLLVASLGGLNKLLLIFNLIPAYPMDGGRILQEILWFIIGYAKSLKYAGMVGVVAGVAMAGIGMGLWNIRLPGGLVLSQDTWLIAIGILVAMESMRIYRQAETMAAWRKR